MHKLSVCIITFDEARNIRDCLESVKWADEIVVVDSGSTDATLEICRAYTDRIFVLDWAGNVAQKNRAVDHATNEWVLSIDADERVSPRLRAEIEGILAADPEHAGYTMPRLTWYVDRWIRHGTWYPDRKLRLFARSRGRFTGLDPHDRVEVRGTVGRLANDLLHYSYRDIAHHVDRSNRYTTTMAAFKEARGVRFPLGRMVCYPPAKFFKMYVLRQGFRDGVSGFVVAVLGSVYEFLKYAKLWELKRKGTGAGASPDKQL
jgi:glycosyltransferase involved in cell wall biosynthesis